MNYIVPHMNHAVPSVDASIRLLALVAAGQGGGPIQSVARRLAITNSSCFRILRTLKDAGWVSEQTTSERSIGPALLQIARTDDAEGRLIQAARGPIRALALQTGLACKLSARRGTQALTLDRSESEAPVSLTSPSGALFTLCLGSSGAVLASDLNATEMNHLVAEQKKSVAWKHQTVRSFRTRVAHARRYGWAMDRGSYHPSIHTISYALRPAAGRIVGAVTLLGMSGDFQPATLRRLRPQLERCARDIMSSFEGGGPLRSGARS
jgi:DNA-binding IclR family transcriptional regulator